MSEVGAVIVTYNSEDVITACLERCRNMDTVVIDNASRDKTVDRVRQCSWTTLIANAENRGFAGAVNQGVRALNSGYILLLNPDVRLRSPIEPLVESCSKAGIGIAGGQLVNADGTVQRGFTVRRLPTPWSLVFEVLGLNRLFPGNRVNRRYRCLNLDLSLESDVEQPAGAFLLFRRELWDRLGGFDPKFYPLWFEDVDFCRRAIDAGQRIRYVPR